MEKDKNKAKENASYKKLFRSSKDKIIAGICGGLGDYFNLDSNLIRIVFILLTVFGGSGLIIYLILWLILPKENQKTQDMEENIRQNVEDIKDQAQSFAQDLKLNIRKEDTRLWLGVVVIIVGFLFLFNNLGLYSFNYVFKLWPLMLIVFGLLILARK